MLWAPGELGLGRAYVTGELQTEGDVISVLRALHEAAPPDLRTGARMPLVALQGGDTIGGSRSAAGASRRGGCAAREAPFEDTATPR